MSQILFTETQNQTLLRIIGAQKAIKIATTEFPDEATINTLTKKHQNGISVSLLIQNNQVDDTTIEQLKSKGINAIHINLQPATKNYTIIDNTDVILADSASIENPCSYIISESDTVQKYLSYFFKRISLNNYATETKSENTSHLAVYESNETEELTFAIEELENLLVLADNEQQEVERIVRNYTHQFNQHLGPLLEEILRMKREYAEQHRSENEFAEQEYQEAKKKEEQFTRERATEAKEGYVELNEEQQEDLKKLYREAILKCHPDKVNEALREKASELTTQLNDAYKKQDIETVKQILADLKNGILTNAAKAEAKTNEHLREKLSYLNNKLKNQIQNLHAAKEDNAFVTASTYNEDPEHFEKLKTQLEKEHGFWEQQS